MKYPGWVIADAVAKPFQVEMCPGGPSGLPNCPNRLACFDDFPRPDIKILHVSIKRFFSFRMRKAQVIAITLAVACRCNNAVRPRQNDGSGGTGKVYPFMKCFFSVKRVFPPPVFL